MEEVIRGADPMPPLVTVAEIDEATEILDDSLVLLLDADRNEVPDLVATSRPLDDPEFEVAEIEVEAAVLKELLEAAKLDVPDEDTVDNAVLAVKFAKKLEVIAEEAVVTPDVVVRLPRRLEAEADEELGAAIDTPTLSALMMSAACRECQHDFDKGYCRCHAKLTFSATAYTTACRCAAGIIGNILASTTLRFLLPCTRR